MHTCGCLDPNFYMNHCRVALHQSFANHHEPNERKRKSVQKTWCCIRQILWMITLKKYDFFTIG